MSVVAPAPATSIPPPAEPAWKEFARAPLVPITIAATIGLVVDRYGQPPLGTEFIVAVVGVAFWLVTRMRRPEQVLIALCLTVGALAAAYHHTHRNTFAVNDIGTFASERPVPARLRGMLDEEPARFRPSKNNPLLAVQKPDTTVTVLAVTAIETSDGWRPATGYARLTVEGRLDGLHLGDEIEVIGRLWRPGPPSNPGELDYRSFLLELNNPRNLG